jgi:hypothetical protein
MELFFQRQEQALCHAGFSAERWKKWFEEGRLLTQLHSQNCYGHNASLLGSEPIFSASEGISRTALMQPIKIQSIPL